MGVVNYESAACRVVICEMGVVSTITLVLSVGSTGASASRITLTVLEKPFDAAQSNGVHSWQFLGIWFRWGFMG